MLDDHAGRERELRGEEPPGGEVVEVVVRELLPVQLLDAREQVHARSGLRVEGAPLVRVLAVREIEDLRERRDELLWERLDVREPARDRRLVGRRRRERDGREASARLERKLAGGAQLGEHRGVLVRPRDGRDMREVLGRGAQHRGPADVDHLDGLLLADAVAGGDLCERIEVHDDEIEREDLVLLECRDVLRAIAAGEDPGVDPRVQRLHAPVEHLRCGGHVLDPLDGQAELLDERGGAATCDEHAAELRESLRQLVEARLVVDRNQRAQSSLTTCGRSLCSTAWIRARSVSTVSPSCTETRSCTITGPVSTPSST